MLSTLRAGCCYIIVYSRAPLRKILDALVTYNDIIETALYTHYSQGNSSIETAASLTQGCALTVDNTNIYSLAFILCPLARLAGGRSFNVLSCLVN